MRVLVTGASGFSGAVVAAALARAGHETVGLHRRRTPFLEAVADTPGLSLKTADLTRLGADDGPFDAVVHTAATSPAPGVDVARMVHDNVAATAALVAAAVDWGTGAFVYFSSLSVHGTIREAVVDESCPMIDPDAYGATKYLGELLLAERANEMPGLALRLPGVLGPGAHRNWFSGVAARLAEGRTVRAFNLDAPFNNAAHVADIAALVAGVIDRPWQGFDAVVLGARGSLPVGAAIERVARGLGVESKVEPVEADQAGFTLSCARAIERWGYDPMEIGDLLERYGREVREHA